MTQSPPTGATRVAAVIGSPVRHSLSPAIHNAAFAAAGLDWTFVALEVAAGDGGAAVAAMRTLGLAGLSVTMPLKAEVVAAVDRCTPMAEALQSVNCIYREGTSVAGDNTDGAGFLDALRVDEGIDPAGRRCVVVGAGGAARAVVAALAGAGAAEVVVAARRPDRVGTAAALAGPVGKAGDVSAVREADLVVNATPVGMAGSADPGGLPFPVDQLRPDHTVVDLVYEPVDTALQVAARAAGAVAVGGLGMLVHQAAHAFRRWTGEDPPVASMRAAVSAALDARTGSAG